VRKNPNHWHLLHAARARYMCFLSVGNPHQCYLRVNGPFRIDWKGQNKFLLSGFVWNGAAASAIRSNVCLASGPRHCDLCVGQKGVLARKPSTYECYVCMIRVWGLGSQNSGRYGQNRNLGAAQFMCAKTLITDIFCMLPGPAICVFCLLETLTNAI